MLPFLEVLLLVGKRHRLPSLSFENRIMMFSGTSSPSIPIVKQHLSLPALTVLLSVQVVTLSFSLI